MKILWARQIADVARYAERAMYRHQREAATRIGWVARDASIRAARCHDVVRRYRTKLWEEYGDRALFL